MQTKLSFMEDLPAVQSSLWDQLEEKHQRVVLEMLAAAIAKMIAAEQHSGANHDR